MREKDKRGKVIAKKRKKIQHVLLAKNEHTATKKRVTIPVASA